MVAIGNPLAYEHTVTVGVVSFIGRKLFDSSFDRYIQTDAAINLGNSGGPLINARGEVVGINAAVSSRAASIGFAVPINQAMAILPQLRDEGRVTRGYIGVKLRTVDADVQRSLRLSSAGGALVQDVAPGSPAERAGLRPVRRHHRRGRHPRGRATTSSISTRRAPAARHLGHAHRAARRPHGDAGREARRAAAAGPPRRRRRHRCPPGRAARRSGWRCGRSTPISSRATTCPSSVRGVVVWRVDAVSPALDADIERGDVILEIDRRPIRSVDDYDRAVANVRPGDVLAVYVYKPSVDERRLSTVRIDDAAPAPAPVGAAPATRWP